ncbi:sensor histidine kinase [Cohnella hashimotonis]|uniref:histidine kinase n=1 Tax=Cohnella hashimotonis TaxID=2826895 RepID=A0ABT6TH06_9BACL|nr:ATP-binding protein [Cohnella hashimotonis]MDI4646128.1 ATP-binding protein [Cohnella hashimotonis]
MKRRSVVVKLFAVTAALVLLVFVLLLLAEGLFFERFYRASKDHAIERSMTAFGDAYRQAEQTKAGSGSRVLGEFMNRNDASLAMLNDRFEPLAVNPYFIELRADGKTVTVPLASEGMTADALPPGLKVGDRLTVDGIYMDEEDTIIQPIAIGQGERALEEGLVRVSGTIAELLVPEHRSYNPFYQDLQMKEALSAWLTDEKQASIRTMDRGTVRTEWTDPWSGVRYAAILQPFAPGRGDARYLFAMTSLQPVGEAVDMLKRYIVFLAPVVLVLGLLLSWIYSRMVSRPLVRLTRSATRLSELEFDGHEEIRSNDEFGELSRRMTAMSRNLKAALAELRQANAQLKQDVEEKERSERLRKELVANISHELKTPLGIVKGFAEGLQDEVAADKRERYLSLIVTETDRMNALIIDMLELSRFEVSAVRLQPEAISLTASIRKALGSFSGQIEEKGLRLTTNADEEWQVEADPKRLEQVLMNLLSNAIRHAAEGGTLAIEVTRPAQGKVRTTIENEGPPIAEADLDRIWKQFYRAERSRDRKTGGTGLGLAIVKHILTLHGSEFGVRNTARGVAFYFTLNETGGDSDDEP